MCEVHTSERITKREQLCFIIAILFLAAGCATLQPNATDVRGQREREDFYNTVRSNVLYELDASGDRKRHEQTMREAYVSSHSELPENFKSAILANQVVIGMTTNDVIAAWPRVDRINRFVDIRGTSEQWIYGDTYLYFTEGILTSIQQW